MILERRAPIMMPIEARIPGLATLLADWHCYWFCHYRCKRCLNCSLGIKQRWSGDNTGKISAAGSNWPAVPDR